MSSRYEPDKSSLWEILYSEETIPENTNVAERVRGAFMGFARDVEVSVAWVSAGKE